MELIRYEGHPTTISLFFNVIFELLVLMLLNLILRALNPALAFSQSELLLIYSMLCIASALAGHDMLQVLLPALPHPYWFATPENKYAERLFPLLPRWLMVSDETALYNFYDGRSSLYLPQNYLPWLKPLAWWTTFVAAMVWTNLCLNTVFRRRWMETERLTYPILHLPRLMTDTTERLFRSRLLWVGMGLAGTVDLVNGLNVFYPKIPIIPSRYTHFNVDQYLGFPPLNVLAGMRASLSPFAIGLGFLLPTDLLFACWFFYLFWRGEIVVSKYLGWRNLPGFPFVEEQALGGYLGLAVFALWVARGYLWQVLRSALGRLRGWERADEPMPYRVALLGLCAGIGYMAWFYWRIGMSLWVIPLYFGLHFLVVTAVTRVRAELGPPAHDLHHIGPEITLARVIGTENVLTKKTLTAFALGYWFNRAYRSIPMPHQLEGMKIAHDLRLNQRSYAAALMLAALVAIPASFWAMLHSYYVRGASHEPSGATVAFGREPWENLNAWLGSPQPANGPALYAIIVGFCFTLLLMALRVRIAWWVFHPVGYAISSSWSMNLLWLPLLVAWVAKVLVVRYGGGAAYRRARHFALGLILGEYTVGTFWCLYGVVMRPPHVYPFWV